MTRTNEELNQNVLRRYYPSTTLILSIAPYAVLYTFTPSSGTWTKSDIEGSLFICALTPSPIGAERFNVVILNRRGFDNFAQELSSSEDVEVTTEYVILKGSDGKGGDVIYGIWIFAEPDTSTGLARETNAGVIEQCALRAEESRRTALERVAVEEQRREDEALVANGNGFALEESEVEDQVAPKGRQVSLMELFGRQRDQDSGFSTHSHESPVNVAPVEEQSAPGQRQETRPVPAAPFFTHPDTDFFRSGPKFTSQQEQAPTNAPAPMANGGNVLEDLFRNAGQGTG